MGFVDSFIRQLTQPADDENETYDGADESSKPAAKVKPQPVQTQPAPAEVPARQAVPRKTVKSAAPVQTQAAPEQESEEADGDEVSAQGGFLSALGIKVGGGRKQAQQSPLYAAAPAAGEASVVIFKPASMLDARELRTYLLTGKQTIVSLDDVADADARRILDYISGIAFAMDARITQFSARSFIIAPANVDIKVNGQA